VYSGTDAMSPRARARITGVVYLLYFLTAVCADVFVGRDRVALYEVVSLVAYALYIAVTLRLYSRRSSPFWAAPMMFLAYWTAPRTKSAAWYFSAPIASCSAT